MSITKKQHYISRGILKHFENETRRVYELILDKGIITPKLITETMSQNYVYEYPALSVNFLEKKFQEIENKVFPILDAVILSLEQDYKHGQNYYKHLRRIKELLPFLVMFYFRSGALLHEYSYYSENPKMDRVERMIANIFNAGYLKGLSKTICDCYDTAIIVDESERFLISDQYLSTVALKYKNRFSNASNRQIGMIQTMLLLPLSSKFYVVFYNGRAPQYIVRNRYIILVAAEVEEINNVIFQNSYVKCVAKHKGELERVISNTILLSEPGKVTACYAKNIITDYVTKREIFLYKEDQDLYRHSFTYMADYMNKIRGKIGRNSLCVCGSGKKYKRCCMSKYDLAKDILWATQHPESVDYNIRGATISEVAIAEFVGHESEFLNKNDRDALSLMNELINENS